MEWLEAAALVGDTELRRQLARFDVLSPTSSERRSLRAEEARFTRAVSSRPRPTLCSRPRSGSSTSSSCPFHLAVVRLGHARSACCGEGRADEGEALLADAREEFARLRAERRGSNGVAAVATAARTGSRSNELTRS